MNEEIKSTGITIPYLAHEGIAARFERTITRLWILCIILIFLLVATNTGWLLYESGRQARSTEVPEQYETQCEEQAKP